MAAAGIATAAATALAGCGSDDTSTPQTIDTLGAAVTSVSDAYSESDEGSHATTTDHELTTGSLLWASSNAYAATLIPGETSRPLVSLGLTSLADGSTTELMHDAVGASEGFDIYDFRASDHVAVWVEDNFLTGAWRVYAAQLRGTTLGDAGLLYEGDSDFEPAPIAAADSVAIWVVQPDENGAHSRDNTIVYAQAPGGSQATTICTSRGRLGCRPHVANNILTITPRLDTSGTYYQLLACDPASGGEISSLTLPVNVRPLDAVWSGAAFAWSVEASYDSGGSLGQYGVYLQQGQDFIRLGRTPQEGLVWIGDKLVCKTGSNLTVLDTAARQYYSITAPSGCASYGDCLATDGAGGRLACYTTVTSDTDRTDSHVSFRVIDLA